MAASASNTGTPSAANSFAVSLLPMPIEPVRPITKGLLAGTEDLHKRIAQVLRDFWPHAKKCLKGRHRLMHQHPKAVDGFVPPRGGIFQQFCFQWIVDDVANCGGFRQGGK